MRFSQYNMEIVHRKGNLNVIPDAFFRVPNACVINTEMEDVESDAWYNKMIQKVTNEPEKYPEWALEITCYINMCHEN